MKFVKKEQKEKGKEFGVIRDSRSFTKKYFKVKQPGPEEELRPPFLYLYK